MMAGALVDTNQIEDSTTDNCLWSLNYTIPEVMEETKDRWRLEKFDDAPLPHYSEEPSLFHKQPIRVYFNNTGNQLFSMYRASCPSTSSNEDPLENCIVIMMSSEKFAAGRFKGYKLNWEIEIQSKTHPSAKTDKKFLRSVEHALFEMRKDTNESRAVFVRCREDDKIMITGGDCGKDDSKYRHIPFHTGIPSGDNIMWVHNKLRTVLNHGTVDFFLWKLQQGRYTKQVQSENAFSSKSQEQRKAEKENWTWVEPRFTSTLRTIVLRDDIDCFVDLFSKQGSHDIISYLNYLHPVLGSSTFLHLAVRNNCCITTQYLLEVGCNPAVVDKAGKVPFEYCGSIQMEAVFMDFREKNEGKYNWNKCKIPERKDAYEQFEDNSLENSERRERRDEKRQRRRAKLDKRRVLHDDI